MSSSLAVVLDLSLARTRIVRRLDAVLGGFHGLSLGDLALLLELDAAPGQRLRRSELAERLGITPSGVARQLAPLERIGLVGRESHARDARLALVVLSDAGAALVADARRSAEEAAEQTLDAIWSDPEQERLARLLERAR
jgi:DNA-binding MarR family transcriptional regulator